MKKILLVLVVAAIGMVSCKKEDIAKPVSVDKTPVAGIDSEVGEWE